MVCAVVIDVRVVLANEPAVCQVHVVMFVPADVRPPDDYQSRVDEIVAYAESFFQREMTRWGHTDIVLPFRRSADGHVEVRLIRGSQNLATYKPVKVRSEVMDENRREDRLAGSRQVWWIMVYAGQPPAKADTYLGGFGLEIGGWAVGDFDLTPGSIDADAPLGSEFLVRLRLKGMLHELGHAFRLPHIGPLLQDKAGNTLMGPTHVNYRQVVPAREERVYLSEAEAALLSIHPAFRGVPDVPGPLPKVKAEGLRCIANRRSSSFRVSGRVVSNERAVYALVADESDARPGEYWTKTYVSTVDSHGNFEVDVIEPAASNGTLKIWFAFENGDQTGDGESRSRNSGIARPYTYTRGGWRFE